MSSFSHSSHSLPPVLPKRRRMLRLFLWLGLITILAVAAGVLMYGYPHQVLTLDNAGVRGDALVVLGGGLHADRAKRAAELYRAGVAPLVLCSGRGDCEANVETLEDGGVPAAAILEEDKSRNTSENARFSLPILRQRGVKRLIIVTSWYHSRRAWHVFHHYAPDLVVYSCPSEEKASRLAVMLEYLKLPEYLLRYGISPI